MTSNSQRAAWAAMIVIAFQIQGQKATLGEVISISPTGYSFFFLLLPPSPVSNNFWVKKTPQHQGLRPS
jgi:hypothetical protein